MASIGFYRYVYICSRICEANKKKLDPKSVCAFGIRSF